MRFAARLTAVLIVVAIVVIMPVSAAAQVSTPESQELPRHPPPQVLQSLTGLNVVTREEVIATIWKMASAASSTLSLLYERSDVYYLLPTPPSLNSFPDLVLYFPALPQAVEDLLKLNSSLPVVTRIDINDKYKKFFPSTISESPPTSVSWDNATYQMQPLIIRVGLEIDYLSVEALALDAMTALQKRDYTALSRISQTAAIIYNLYEQATTRKPAGEQSNTATITLLSLSLRPDCENSLKPALYSILSKSIWTAMPDYEYLASRVYASELFYSNTSGGPCIAELVDWYPWHAPIAYVDSFASTIMSLLKYIGSIVRLDPAMESLVILPKPIVANASASLPFISENSGLANASASIFNLSQSSPFERGLNVQPTDVAKLGSLAQNLAPDPSDLSNTIERLVESKGYGGGGIELQQPFRTALREPLKPAGLPIPTRRIGLPSVHPTLPLGASALAMVTLVPAFVALAFLMVRRRGVYLQELLSRSLRGLYAALVTRVSSGRGVHPSPVECYKYALRLSSVYAGPKRYSETPREYLQRAHNSLPSELRKLLRKATALYERYRYARLPVDDSEVCGA